MMAATLDAGALDFTPYSATFACWRAASATNRQLFDRQSAVATDLDHASCPAAKSRSGDQTSAAPLSAPPPHFFFWRPARAALSVVEAQMRRHRQRAVRIARSDAWPMSMAQVPVLPMSTAGLASDCSALPNFPAAANLNVSLLASGASPFGLASSLDGTAVLTRHDGANRASIASNC